MSTHQIPPCLFDEEKVFAFRESYHCSCTQSYRDVHTHTHTYPHTANTLHIHVQAYEDSHQHTNREIHIHKHTELGFLSFILTRKFNIILGGWRDSSAI